MTEQPGHESFTSDVLVARTRLTDVLSAIARLEGKVDASLIGQARIERTLVEQDSRLREAERDIAALKAARPRPIAWTSVASAVVAMVMALFALLNGYRG